MLMYSISSLSFLMLCKFYLETKVSSQCVMCVVYACVSVHVCTVCVYNDKSHPLHHLSISSV